MTPVSFVSNRKLKYSAWLALLVVTYILANHQPGMLTVAATQGVESIALTKIAQEFSAQHNIVIQVKEFPYDNLYKIELEAARSASPLYDVILADDPWLPALFEAGPPDLHGNPQQGLRQITLKSADCNEMLDDMVEACIGVCRRKDEPDRCVLFALPFVGNSQLFCFRNSGNAGAPATWADIMATQGYVMRVGRGNSIVTDFMPLLWEKGLLIEDFNHLLSRGSLSAFQELTDLRTKTEANHGITSYDDFDLAIHLAKNTASMSIVWSAWAMAITKVQTSSGDTSINEIHFKQVPGRPVLGTWLLAIPHATQHPNEAQAFVQFATEKRQIATAAKEGNPPPRKSILNCETYPGAEDNWPEECGKFKTFQNQLLSLENALPRPRTPRWKTFEAMFGDVLFDVYGGAVDPEEACHRTNVAILKAVSDGPFDSDKAALQAETACRSETPSTIKASAVKPSS